MKVLMIGDVVSRPGRLAVLEKNSGYPRNSLQSTFAVMNAEKRSGRVFQSLKPLADQLFNSGIDVMTSGNHIYDKKEVIPYIEKQPRLLRPANYPANSPGKRDVEWHSEGSPGGCYKRDGTGILCHPRTTRFMLRILWSDHYRIRFKVRLVDVHAEATSEKGRHGLVFWMDGCQQWLVRIPMCRPLMNEFWKMERHSLAIWV